MLPGNAFVFVPVMALCLLLLCATGDAAFEAGAAVRVVTPDPLLPVSGGIGPSQPATEKSGDITVRALVMRDADTTVAIVGSGFLGFPHLLGDRVRAGVGRIPPENIIIGVTHTHSAPDMYAFPDGQGGTGADLDYIDRVCGEMAAAINEALDAARPAAIRVGTGDVPPGIAYNYYAPDLYDPRCDVVQFAGDDGRSIATLVNFAVHPEVLGNKLGVLSPDLCGPLYERIEEQGGGTAIFMNGALGGMVTADNRRPDGTTVKTWDECVRIGHALADIALAIVADAPLQRNPDLFCAARTVNFPLDSDELRAVLEQSPLPYEPNEDGTVPAQVNVVNLGNAQMLTIPGEALPNVGYYLKRNMRGEHNLLLGLTNDAYGYILAKVDYDSFRRYDYITRVSLGEMTGEIFIEEALAFIEECPRPERIASVP